MHIARLADTPDIMGVNLKRRPAENTRPALIFPYCEAVGALLYASNCLRPDITPIHESPSLYVTSVRNT